MNMRTNGRIENERQEWMFRKENKRKERMNVIMNEW